MNQTDAKIIRLAIPALGSLAVEPLYVLADTAIVGRVGTAELAGLGAAGAILAVVFAGSNFLTYGTTERIARELGAGAPVRAANIAIQTLWLAVVVGVVAALVVAGSAATFIGWLGTGEDAAPFAVRYLTISALSIPAVVVTLGAQGVLRGAGNYVTPMWVLLASNVTNVIVELVMVGVLGWGIAGSAWSTVLSQYLAVFMILWWLWSRAPVSPAQRRPSWSKIVPLVRTGGFLVVRVGSMLAVLVTATALATRGGSVSLAAHSVLTSLMLLISLVLDALAMPAQNLVAERLGRGDTGQAKVVGQRVIVLSLIAAVVLAAMVWASASGVGALFSPDLAVGNAVATAAGWLGVGTLFGSVAFACDGVLIGAAEYRFVGLAAAATTAVLVPIAWWIGASGPPSLRTVWAWLALWYAVRALLTGWRFGHIARSWTAGASTAQP